MFREPLPRAPPPRPVHHLPRVAYLLATPHHNFTVQRSSTLIGVLPWTVSLLFFCLPNPLGVLANSSSHFHLRICTCPSRAAFPHLPVGCTHSLPLLALLSRRLYLVLPLFGSSGPWTLPRPRTLPLAHIAINRIRHPSTPDCLLYYRSLPLAVVNSESRNLALCSPLLRLPVRRLLVELSC